MQEIAILVDFSDATPAVVKTAAWMAEALGAKIHLLHASLPEMRYTVATEAGAVIVDPGVIEAELRQDQERLAELGAQLRKQGFQVDVKLLHGPAVSALTDQIGQLAPSLVIAGSHGHGALYHLLMGSVTSAVLRKARCPVLVVPSRNA